MTNLEIIEAYKNDLIDRCSVNEETKELKITRTVEDYPKKILKVLTYLNCFVETKDGFKNVYSEGEKKITDLTLLELGKINTYFTQVKKYSDNSYNANASAIRSFFNFCRGNKLIDGVTKDDIADKFPRKKVTDKNNRGQNPLPSDKYEAFIKFLMSLDNKGIRNCRKKAIVWVALTTGLRASELNGLKRSDIDFEKGVIYAKDTKGFKPRAVPLMPNVKETLDSLFSIYEKLGLDGEYVFLSERGNKMERSNMSSTIKSLMKMAVKENVINEDEIVSPHGLRKGLATYLSVNMGMNNNDIISLLGHSNDAQLKKYIKTEEMSMIDRLKNAMS